MQTVKLEGFRELERALAEDMPKAAAKSTLRRAGIRSMKRLEEAARRYAPKQRGELAGGITTKVVKAKRQAGSAKFARSEGIEVETGPTGRPEGGNAAWQEFGTVKMSAQPYMRPAADAELPHVAEQVREELRLQIEKTKKRIARKAAKIR